MFIDIMWPWCHQCKLSNIDEFARVRKVVNHMNALGSCFVFYHVDTESDEVDLHIRRKFLLEPQLSDINLYMKAIMQSFFITARELELEIEKERLAECHS